MNAPMKVIQGKVENLSMHTGEEEFIRSRAQQAAGGAAAVGLALGGLAGPAVGGAIAATGADSVEFFTCTVNGEPVGGRFSKVTFKDGDEVEVLLEGANSALAVRRPADRMLWMLPHSSRGKAAHRLFALRLAVWVLLAFLLSSVVFVWIMEGMTAQPLDPSDIRFIGALYAILSAICAGYFSIRFFFRWKPIAARTESILEALGYRNPSRVDLEKDNKRAAKARGEKWPYPTGGPWIYRYPEDC